MLNEFGRGVRGLARYEDFEFGEEIDNDQDGVKAIGDW